MCGCRPAGHGRLRRPCGNAGGCRKPPGERDNEGKQRGRVRTPKRTKCRCRAPPNVPQFGENDPSRNSHLSEGPRSEAMAPPLGFLRLRQPGAQPIIRRSTTADCRRLTYHGNLTYKPIRGYGREGGRTAPALAGPREQGGSICEIRPATNGRNCGPEA